MIARVLSAPDLSKRFSISDRAIKTAATHFIPSERSSLFAPYAGTGEALVYLARLLSVPRERVYGIEELNCLGATLRKRLAPGNALAPCNYETANVSGGFSVCLINPPRDGNWEARTLLAIDKMAVESVAMISLPRSEATYGYQLRSALQKRLGNMRSITDGRDTLVIGRKTSEGGGRFVEKDTTPIRLFDFNPPSQFKKVKLSEDELIAIMEKNVPEFFTHKADMQKNRPPLSLGSGHVALLLASGELDGYVESEGRKPHVVRGSARKEKRLAGEVSEIDRKGNKVKTETYSEEIVLTVRFVEQDGAIHTVENTQAKEDDDE
ncbi:hypothetical protein [Rosistilla oblonga]|uniref:hypothetical protein n=1 Tax=Rosistilla oblonga TaxID=2527990 RepID=UPI003A9710A7